MAYHLPLHYYFFRSLFLSLYPFIFLLDKTSGHFYSDNSSSRKRIIGRITFNRFTLTLLSCSYFLHIHINFLTTSTSLHLNSIPSNNPIHFKQAYMDSRGDGSSSSVQFSRKSELSRLKITFEQDLSSLLSFSFHFSSTPLKPLSSLPISSKKCSDILYQ